LNVTLTKFHTKKEGQGDSSYFQIRQQKRNYDGNVVRQKAKIKDEGDKGK